MIPSKLIQAIGEIDDEFIVKFADVKQRNPQKTTLKRILAIAACFIFLFFSVSMIIFVVEKTPSNVIDIVDKMQYCIFDGKRYLIITDDIKKKLYDLPVDILEDSIGDYVGSGYLEEDNTKLKIYDYLCCDDDTIMLVEFNNDLCYILQHNNYE